MAQALSASLCRLSRDASVAVPCWIRNRIGSTSSSGHAIVKYWNSGSGSFCEENEAASASALRARLCKVRVKLKKKRFDREDALRMNLADT